MARDHARIQCDIWTDEDWRPLSTLAKLLYVQLLSQPKLSYAGLLDLAAKRWARAHPDRTVAEIRSALSELDNARMLVVDHDTEEVLIRTLIRNDGIFKQPQVLAAAMRQAFEIESPVLRGALAAELRRLPVDVCGSGPSIVAAALEAGASQVPDEAKPPRRRAESSRAGAVEPDEGAPEASRKGAATPARKGSAQVQGVGGGGLGKRPGSTLGRSSLGRAARADKLTRDKAADLVAEHVPAQPGKVAARLASETAALLAEGIPGEQVVAGLRRWSRKRVGAGLLPELVGEAMRAGATTPNTGDPLTAALALARKVAEEDQDDTELGRILRTERDDQTALAALLAVGAVA